MPKQLVFFDKKKFGARLRDLRIRAGLSQQALGERCGYGVKSPRTAQTRIGNYEKGLYAPLGEIPRLAAALQAAGGNPELELREAALGKQEHSREVLPLVQWAKMATHRPRDDKPFQVIATFNYSREDFNLRKGDILIVDPAITPAPGHLVIIESDDNLTIVEAKGRRSFIDIETKKPVHASAVVGVIVSLTKNYLERKPR